MVATPLQSDKPSLPPGPRYAIPGVGLMRFRKDPLGFLTRIKEQYGEFVAFKSFGRQFLVITNPDALKEILVTQADAFTKTPALQSTKRFFGEGLLTSEADVHRSHRKLMQPAFHAKHVESYTDDVIAATLELCEAWKKNGRHPLDVHPEMMRLTLIIAGKTLFGRLLVEETDAIGEAMETLVEGTQRMIYPWGKLLDHLPLPSTFRIRKAERVFKGLCDRLIAERRKDVAEGRELTNDLLSMMINATDADPEIPAACPYSKKVVRLSDSELRDQCITILAAGHETTANAMTFALYLLALHPEEQNRLREEVERHIGNRMPTPADIDAMPRVTWVISEAMRLYPPVWTVGRQAQRPVKIGKYMLPSKSIVLMPPYTLQRDERYFPEPDVFRPSRWENPTHPRYAYLPFSTGPRNCIGESFAWLEMSLSLTMLMQRFEFSLVDHEAPFELKPAITLRPKHPVNLRITPRVLEPVETREPVSV